VSFANATAVKKAESEDAETAESREVDNIEERMAEVAI